MNLRSPRLGGEVGMWLVLILIHFFIRYRVYIQLGLIGKRKLFCEDERNTWILIPANNQSSCPGKAYEFKSVSPSAAGWTRTRAESWKRMNWKVPWEPWGSIPRRLAMLADVCRWLCRHEKWGMVRKRLKGGDSYFTFKCVQTTKVIIRPHKKAKGAWPWNRTILYCQIVAEPPKQWDLIIQDCEFFTKKRFKQQSIRISVGKMIHSCQPTKHGGHHTKNHGITVKRDNLCV